MAAPPGQVRLEDLDMRSLAEVRTQLEEELKHLTNAFGELKQAQAKFTSCMEALDTIKPGSQDKKVLIPLTSSLYVPGRISNVETVLVDVGTGYFVEKDTKAAKTLYNSKTLALRSNLEVLQRQIETKQSNYNSASEVLRQKLAHQQHANAAQQQAE
ncbi:subunit of tubulin prefoldin [Microbotryomycetes sp. JL221]|nr:subunit of tubulin prefoldin [Microbotryomycetes sp. JL221]